MRTETLWSPIREKLLKPLQWRKPRTVCVRRDLFHPRWLDDDIAAVFGVMAATPHITYRVVTTHVPRLLAWFSWISGGDLEVDLIRLHAQDRLGCWTPELGMNAASWPLPNVWIGVRVNNQAEADERILDLLEIPAIVRFVSAEPLLGPIRLDYILRSTTRLDWVRVGCESPPLARPCQVEWLRSLRDQCKTAGIPFFLTQACMEKAAAKDPEHPDGYTPARVWIGPDAQGPTSYEPGALIKLPYLDGVQHIELPSTRSPMKGEFNE